MKKILLLVAVASLLSACGGGGGSSNGVGTNVGVPGGGGIAGQGDSFVSAVLAVINAGDSDTQDAARAGQIYDGIAETTNETNIPDTLV